MIVLKVDESSISGLIHLIQDYKGRGTNTLKSTGLCAFRECV